MAGNPNRCKPLKVTIPMRSAPCPLPEGSSPQSSLPELPVRAKSSARVTRRNAIHRPSPSPSRASPTLDLTESTMAGNSNHRKPLKVTIPIRSASPLPQCSPPQSSRDHGRSKALKVPIPIRSVTCPLPQCSLPQSSLPELPARAKSSARVTRRNAIRRPSLPPSPASPTLDLKDISINGDLVNRALAVPPPSPPPPPRNARRLPAMKPSKIDYSTLPLPPIPQLHGEDTPRPRRRVIFLLDGLIEELRNLQLENELTQDDPT